MRNTNEHFADVGGLGESGRGELYGGETSISEDRLSLEPPQKETKVERGGPCAKVH